MDQESKEYILRHGLDGIIRIPQDEYNFSGGLFVHFNLEKTDCEVGKSYVLPRILKSGYSVRGKEEVLPELSFENVYHGVCLEVHNHLAYESLKPDDFTYSFLHIQNVEELKTYILQRYTKSRGDLSEDDILKLGVSRMLLKIEPAR